MTTQQEGTAMHVELGQDVYGWDNKKVGTIDRLVINPRTKEVEQFVVGQGFFTHEDKLVDLSMVAHGGNEGVVLNVPSATVHQLPTFVKEDFLEARPEHLADRPIGYADGMGGRTLVLGTPDVGRGYEGGGSLYDPAPINPPIEVTKRNIPSEDVTIGKGSNVVSSDGHDLGQVKEVFFDNRGNTTGFEVESGLLRQRQFRIPIAWVGEIDDNKVHLTVTEAEVHSRRSPEGNPI